MKDVHGKAILDHYNNIDERLILHNSYGDPEEMPLEVFFKEQDDFSEIENLAITHCRGKVLDIGAGAGTHSLFLQQFGAEIVALENSIGCVQTMKLRGVNEIACEDYKAHQGKYDTLFCRNTRLCASN